MQRIIYLLVAINSMFMASVADIRRDTVKSNSMASKNLYLQYWMRTPVISFQSFYSSCYWYQEQLLLDAPLHNDFLFPNVGCCGIHHNLFFTLDRFLSVSTFYSLYWYHTWIPKTQPQGDGFDLFTYC